MQHMGLRRSHIEMFEVPSVVTGKELLPEAECLLHGERVRLLTGNSSVSCVLKNNISSDNLC